MSIDTPSASMGNNDGGDDTASSDAPEPDLLELLRQKFQADDGSRSSTSRDTGVLGSASFICDNSIDVALDPRGTKAAATRIWESMQREGYDRTAWGKHELHPSPGLADKGNGSESESAVSGRGEGVTEKEKEEKEEEEDDDDIDDSRETKKPGNLNEEHPVKVEWGADATLDFIFTMDLLNFCFWSEKSSEERFAIEYKGKRWTGYLSLVAALRRALDEGWFLLLSIAVVL